MTDEFTSARDMLTALRSKTISCAELLAMHIDRIDRYDSKINAVVVRDFERASEAAKAADQRTAGNDLAPLSGLPMTVKESINVEGLSTCCGMQAARDFVSSHDSPTARRLKEAGAIIIGKTNVPVELTDWQSDNPVYGRTNNPYDASRTPGGSSGGSAAALAAGMTPLEVGSDIGGSIRVPAAFCGVVGHRPSETALAKSGQFPVVPTPIPAAVLGVQGPLARSAGDVRLAMQSLVGADIGEDQAWRLELPPPRHSRLADFRVAALAIPEWVPIDNSVRESYESLLDGLRQEGCNVNIAQPQSFSDWRDHSKLYNQLLGAMLSVRCSDEVRIERAQKLRETGDETGLSIAEGLDARLNQVFQWLAGREKVRADWREFFQNYDIFLTPAVMRNAFAHMAFDEPGLIASRNVMIDVDGQSHRYWSQLFFPSITILAGQPATAFPVGPDADGLPTGMQAVGPYLEDYTPIHFTELLEQHGLAKFIAPDVDAMA